MDRVSWIVPKSTYVAEELGPAIIMQVSVEEMSPATVMLESSKKEKLPSLFHVAEEMGPATVMQESTEKLPYLNSTIAQKMLLPPLCRRALRSYLLIVEVAVLHLKVEIL